MSIVKKLSDYQELIKRAMADGVKTIKELEDYVTANQVNLQANTVTGK